MVFFSCAEKGTKGDSAAGSRADTSLKNEHTPGNPATSNQTNTKKPGIDTALQYKMEIRNNGPEQSRIDSIKNAKTKKKK
jgi:hypothetical protein